MAFVQQGWITAGTDATVSDVEEVPGTSNYGWQISTTGSPTQVDLRLEGSIDGSAWFTLDRITSAVPVLRWVANSPVVSLRVNIVTLQGGTNPTATIHAVAV